MEASVLHPSHGLAVSPRLLRLARDDRLVALVRAGNAAAFEVVYDRYHRQLLSFCRHMLGRAGEAEDAVQQTFISAHDDLRRSDRPVALRAWLFTIARNRCLSMLRARREASSLEDVEPETAGLAAEVQRREDLRSMLGDISRLPEDQRAALVLAELGDLDHAEIAEILACPREKVKALVFQARSSLSLSRRARETSCEDIRAQLSTLRGGALRRASLRRHLRDCAGCREFRDEVRRQRAAMAVLLPVAPAVGLKKAVLTAAGVSTGGGGAGMGAAGAGLAGAKLAALKAGAAAALLGAGAVGGAALVNRIDSSSPGHRGTAIDQVRRADDASSTAAALPAASSAAAAAVAARPHGAVAGGAHSNRAAAHQNALAHGHKRGLLGTQPGRNRTSTASHGQGVGPGGRGRGSDASSTSQGNAGGSGFGRDRTGAPSNSSHAPSSGSNASSGVSVPSTPSESTSGAVHGQANGRS